MSNHRENPKHREEEDFDLARFSRHATPAAVAGAILLVQAAVVCANVHWSVWIGACMIGTVLFLGFIREHNAGFVHFRRIQQASTLHKTARVCTGFLLIAATVFLTMRFAPSPGQTLLCIAAAGFGTPSILLFIWLRLRSESRVG